VAHRYTWNAAPSDGQWESLALPADAGPLQAVWGSSASEVYAVGRNGTIVSFDGTSWTTVPTSGDVLFRDIAGVGRDAIAVGDNGAT
jgi:hypothetical protein